MSVPNPDYQLQALPLKAVQVIPLDEHGEEIAAGRGIKTASGFIRHEPGGLFLYTCWHVVTGIKRYPVTMPPAPFVRPWRLRIRSQDTVFEPGVERIGGLRETVVELYHEDQRTPRWAQDARDVPYEDLNAVGLRVPFWHDAVKIAVGDGGFSDFQLVEAVTRTQTPLPGHKLLIVGYPYGYSALGPAQPTPIVLTRFVAAMMLEGRFGELLLDGAGAEGMSGGPVFHDEDGSLRCVGLYTGLIYPDRNGNRATALGTFCSLARCWTTPDELGLVFETPL
jgi:hypothetical protein